MQNKLIENYVLLKKQFQALDGNSSSVLALYQFKDELEQDGSTIAKQMLIDVYYLLGLMQSACDLLLEIIDKRDRNQLKKLAQLQDLKKSHGNHYALPRPKTEVEKAQQTEKMKQFPQFRYHPNPLETGAFKEGEAKTCPCCGENSTIQYSIMPYCIDNIKNLCPDCIATGRAAQKYQATFIQDAQWTGPPAKDKEDLLFHCTPGYPSWQGEYWLSCCNDYCAYLGTVGTRELKAMDIAEEVFAEYGARGGFAKASLQEHLSKDGSLCGYLFQCLHCGKYHLGVDAD